VELDITLGNRDEMRSAVDTVPFSKWDYTEFFDPTEDDCELPDGVQCVGYVLNGGFEHEDPSFVVVRRLDTYQVVSAQLNIGERCNDSQDAEQLLNSVESRIGFARNLSLAIESGAAAFAATAMPAGYRKIET
jgi:hypothetical protein